MRISMETFQLLIQLTGMGFEELAVEAQLLSLENTLKYNRLDRSIETGFIALDGKIEAVCFDR